MSIRMPKGAAIVRTRKVITPENDVRNAGLKFLNMQPGVLCWRRNTGVGRLHGFHVRFGKVNAADIEGIGPEGVHIEAEAKKTDDKPNEDQLAWLEDIRSRGGIAFWFDSLEMCIREWNHALLIQDVPVRYLNW